MKKLILTIFFLCIICSLGFAEIAIYCPKCKRHLYNYQKDEIEVTPSGIIVKAKDFVPSCSEIEQPHENDKMVCPFDGAELNGWEYYADLQGYKSFVLGYAAISLLTKDNDNKWKWLPIDMPNLDMNKEEIE